MTVPLAVITCDRCPVDGSRVVKTMRVGEDGQEVKVRLCPFWMHHPQGICIFKPDEMPELNSRGAWLRVMASQVGKVLGRYDQLEQMAVTIGDYRLMLEIAKLRSKVISQIALGHKAGLMDHVVDHADIKTVGPGLLQEAVQLITELKAKGEIPAEIIDNRTIEHVPAPNQNNP